MADAMVAAVEALGVYAVQLAHSLGKIGIRRFYHQMIVITHLAVGVTNPVEALTDLRERFQPRDAIIIA